MGELRGLEAGSEIGLLNWHPSTLRKERRTPPCLLPSISRFLCLHRFLPLAYQHFLPVTGKYTSTAPRRETPGQSAFELLRAAVGQVFGAFSIETCANTNIQQYAISSGAQDILSLKNLAQNPVRPFSFLVLVTIYKVLSSRIPRSLEHLPVYMSVCIHVNSGKALVLSG